MYILTVLQDANYNKVCEINWLFKMMRGFPEDFEDSRMVCEVHMLDNCRIIMAQECDTMEILSLYRTQLGGPAEWNEYYPNEDTIAFDLERDALFVMKNELNEIIAAISIDSDEAVDALECWDQSLRPSGEVSRLCVRDDMKNQGIARRMMQHIFDILKKRGYKSVHILVKTGHVIALSSYAHLDFIQVGECRLFDKDFVCLEKVL